MTVQANPGGVNFGALLDRGLAFYQENKLSKIERDRAMWNAAGQVQASALHSPEAMTQGEAYAVGNAQSPGQRRTAGSYIDAIPKVILYPAMALLTIGVAKKAKLI